MHVKTSTYFTASNASFQVLVHGQLVRSARQDVGAADAEASDEEPIRSGRNFPQKRHEIIGIRSLFLRSSCFFLVKLLIKRWLSFWSQLFWDVAVLIVDDHGICRFLTDVRYSNFMMATEKSDLTFHCPSLLFSASRSPENTEKDPKKTVAWHRQGVKQIRNWQQFKKKKHPFRKNSSNGCRQIDLQKAIMSSCCMV